MRKRLVIHMDDIGINDGSIQAAKALFETGICLSASVIVPGSHAKQFLNWAKGKEYDIGIHSAVTCEWKTHRFYPLGRPEDTMSFRAEDGAMISGTEEELRQIREGEYAGEIERQILAARENGNRLTHLDSHMWAFRERPELLRCYLETADRYHMIPHIPEWCLWDEERRKLAEESGYPIVTGEWFLKGDTYEEKKAYLMQLPDRLTDGLHVLTIHPNLETGMARSVISNLQERIDEAALFLDAEVQDFWADNRDLLTTWEKEAALWKRD